MPENFERFPAATGKDDEPSAHGLPQMDIDGLLDAASEVLLIIEAGDGTILHAAGRINGVLGYGAEELLATHIGDLSAGYAPYTGTQYQERLTLEAASGGPPFEWPLVNRTGDIVWVEVRCTVPRTGGDRMVVSMHDITERKDVERQGKAIQDALDDCGSGVLIVDPDLKVAYLNTSFTFMLGYYRDEAQELGLRTLFEEDDWSEVATILADGRMWEGEKSVTTKSGMTLTTIVRAMPMLEDDYVVAGYIFIVDDISERRKLETELLASQKMKSIGQLASGIAHEINTPLQYVGDNAHFLKDSFDETFAVLKECKSFIETLDPAKGDREGLDTLKEKLRQADLDYLQEEVPTAIKQSLEGIEHVRDLVKAMRQFSHPGTGEKSMVNLNEAVETAVAVSRNEWRYAADVVMELDPELPQANCFPGDLNQVILNLIVNAAHAIADAVDEKSGEKGAIKISSSAGPKQVEIRVADTGGGIPPEHAERIFEPFYTTKDVGKGSGQGLAISHSIVVDKHGGELEFETDAGVGTTFFIRIPLEGSVSTTKEGAEDVDGRE